MSLINGRQEYRTILDFSKQKISKTKVKRALSRADVIEIERDAGNNSYNFIENEINVGMYQIRLSFYSLSTEKRTKLKEYGGFSVVLYEKLRENKRYIDLSYDERFKDQYWVKPNKDYKIRMKNLIDIIMYTQRLDKLKMLL